MRQFHGGVVWIDVVVRHLVLMTAMLGAALAAAKGGHISIDLLGRLWKNSAQVYVMAAADLLAAWICVRLTQGAITFVQMSHEFGDTVEALNQPAWLWQLAIPLGFGLAALHFLIDALLRVFLPEQEADS